MACTREFLRMVKKKKVYLHGKLKEDNCFSTGIQANKCLKLIECFIDNGSVDTLSKCMDMLKDKDMFKVAADDAKNIHPEMIQKFMKKFSIQVKDGSWKGLKIHVPISYEEWRDLIQQKTKTDPNLIKAILDNQPLCEYIKGIIAVVENNLTIINTNLTVDFLPDRNQYQEITNKNTPIGYNVAGVFNSMGISDHFKPLNIKDGFRSSIYDMQVLKSYNHIFSKYIKNFRERQRMVGNTAPNPIQNMSIQTGGFYAPGPRLFVGVKPGLATPLTPRNIRLSSSSSLAFKDMFTKLNFELKRLNKELSTQDQARIADGIQRLEDIENRLCVLYNRYISNHKLSKLFCSINGTTFPEKQLSVDTEKAGEELQKALDEFANQDKENINNLKKCLQQWLMYLINEMELLLLLMNLVTNLNIMMLMLFN